jgi:adenylate cyclase
MAEGGGEGHATDAHSGTHDVFVSYASQDSAVADDLTVALEGQGIKCWIAPRDVTPGAHYASEIVHAIDSAKAIVLILSQDAATSPHVLREIERATSKRHPVVTLRLDQAPLPAEFEYFLNTSQWLDASSSDATRMTPKLMAAVKSAIKSPAGTPAVPLTAHASSRPASARSPNRTVIVVVSLIGLIVAGFAVNSLWLSSRYDASTPAAAKLASVPPPAPAAPTIPEKSIAVLPFTDMSEKHDQEYFGDGMAEEILDLLAKIPGLTVIGRTSSFQFKAKSEDLRTIGAKLNAAYVLEGSVRKAGDQLRITAQLVNTRTGTHEWSETYDRQFGDVLKLQDAIAAAVVRELQLTVTSGDMNSRSTLKDSAAYDMVLRGRHEIDRFDREGLEEAARLFQQTLARDPSSVDAAAGLACAYYNLGAYGFLPPALAYEQSRRAATNALRLDPGNALAHWTLGGIHQSYDWNWAAADQEFRQVATIAPGAWEALNGKAWLSLILGRWDEGLSQIKAALAQDPLNPDSYEGLAWIQMGRAHLPEAEAAMRRALDIRPTYSWGHFMLGMIMLERGDPRVALLEMQKEQQEVAQLSGLAMVYHALGRTADADAALTRLIKEQANENAFQIANVYAFRGQIDEAMRWLERAYAQKDFSLYLIKAWLPPSLVADPRYKAFLRKMNLPE